MEKFKDFKTLQNFKLINYIKRKTMQKFKDLIIFEYISLRKKQTAY